MSDTSVLSLYPVPQEMPTPTVTALSSESVNVSWEEPTDKQTRGVVQQYTVYHYKASDLSISPFAPTYQWVVSISNRSVYLLKLGYAKYFANRNFRWKKILANS